MAMSTCPRCGTPVQPNATMCTACGFNLTASADPPPPATPVTPPPDPMQASVDPTPAGASSPGSATARTAAAGEALRAGFNDTLERWGVEQSPMLTGALVLAAISFLIGTFALISYLTAGDSEFLQKLDAEVWFQLAVGAAVGAAALLILVRWQAPVPKTETAAGNPDLRIGLVLCGLIVAFVLAGLFKGQDESSDAVSAWFSYSRVFVFLTLGWFAISRPIPGTIGSLQSTVIGLVLVGIGAVALIIGTIQGRSEDNSAFISGLSFLGAGTTFMLMAVGWFLGLRPQRDA